MNALLACFAGLVIAQGAGWQRAGGFELAAGRAAAVCALRGWTPREYGKLGLTLLSR